VKEDAKGEPVSRAPSLKEQRGEEKFAQGGRLLGETATKNKPSLSGTALQKKRLLG